MAWTHNCIDLETRRLTVARSRLVDSLQELSKVLRTLQDRLSTAATETQEVLDRTRGEHARRLEGNRRLSAAVNDVLDSEDLDRMVELRDELMATMGRRCDKCDRVPPFRELNGPMLAGGCWCQRGAGTES